MARTPVRRPDERPLTAERIALAERFNYQTRIMRNVPVAELTPAIQTRLRLGFPEDTLKQYMENLRGGAVFPMPVITEDKGVVLGKTTTEAYKRLGTKTVDVLILNGVHYIDASQSTLDDLLLMDAESNQANGLRLQGADLIKAIEVAWHKQFSVTRIAAITGVSVRRVNFEITRIKAADRMSTLSGLDSFRARLADNQMSTLGRVSDLHDEPYAELVKLAADAGLTATAIDLYARQLRDARSDAAAIRRIKDARTLLSVEINNRIRKGIKGNRRQATPWGMLSLHLAGVKAVAGKEAQVLYGQQVSEPETRMIILRDLQDAIDVLEKVKATVQ